MNGFPTPLAAPRGANDLALILQSFVFATKFPPHQGPHFYHNFSCDCLTTIPYENLIIFGAVVTAQEKGLIPCTRCHQQPFGRGI